jgi:hypothetical protein
MPTIQISQIILRSGPSVDLPGAPTSLTPLAFGPGLEPGEAAFMTDTGRIYIGHDPSQGQPNFQRAVFPYQNIEVLTENSLDTLAEYWAQAPLMKCAYDGEDCSEWPGPWEMIHARRLVPYSVAIGMEFTSGWPVGTSPPDRLKLSVTTIFPTSAWS